jgi:hypothetical protein
VNQRRLPDRDAPLERGSFALSTHDPLADGPPSVRETPGSYSLVCGTFPERRQLGAGSTQSARRLFRSS